MLSKCCTQYVSKSGKPTNGHSTGKGQSSSQFQRRAVLRNVQTTRQLHSSPMLVKLCSKSSKLGFRITWRELPDVHAGFRKGRGTRNQIANIHWITEKAREFQKNIYLCFIDHTKAFDCVDHNKLWKALKEMGILDHLTCLLRNLYAGQEQQLESCMEQLIGSRLRKENNRAECCHPVCLIYNWAHHEECWAGWVTSWNQDCWEKYQQP